ncbi:MAG: hypothetical protein OXF77_04950 [Thaumarchaeota archaeon]|nr:hypothetical protein [Nitrososphaerota archaeon]
MPELWLDYGQAEIVIDIRSENLHRQICKPMPITMNNKQQIFEKLNSINIEHFTKIVVFEDTGTILQIIYLIFDIFNKKLKLLPQILVPDEIFQSIKNKIPRAKIEKFCEIPNEKFILINDAHFDGLFGFSTAATELLKRSKKQDLLLSAYRKRHGDLPAPGKQTIPLKLAREFVANLDVVSIEIITDSNNVHDIIITHPSSISSLSKSLMSSCINIGKQNAMIINYGNNEKPTFQNTLEALWNCSSTIANNGIAILISECSCGIGSNAIRRLIERRFNVDSLKDPIEYINGMENLLFLSELNKKIKIGLVSILPLYYINQLNLFSFHNGNSSLDYILSNKGIKQKITVVFNARRILLK